MFEVAGLLDEGIEQLEQLIGALKSGAHKDSFNKELGEALVHQALLYFRKGQFLRSRDLYRESIRILRPVGDPLLLADALIYSGIITHLFGDFKEAKELLQEGLGVARSANDPWLIAYAIDNLGYIDSQLGYYTEGYQQMMKGVEIWRTLGDPHTNLISAQGVCKVGDSGTISVELITVGLAESCRNAMPRESLSFQMRCRQIEFCRTWKTQGFCATASRWRGCSAFQNQNHEVVCVQRAAPARSGSVLFLDLFANMRSERSGPAARWRIIWKCSKMYWPKPG